MIEKVARAITIEHLKVRWRTPPNPELLKNRLEEEWPLYVITAKAAIEAMREPTNDQANNYFKIRKEAGDSDATACFNVSVWESMIDAALKK